MREFSIPERSVSVGFLTVLAIAVVMALMTTSAKAEHTFNGAYTDANLNRIAFPIGGIGSGMYCLEGTGAISHVSVRHRMEFFHEPTTFAAICVKNSDDPTGETNVARVVEGPVPDWKFFGMPNTGTGAPGATYGLPRFRACEFSMRFPFCEIALTDEKLPLTARITGFSPFIPTDEDMSSLPAGTLEYTFTNTSDAPVDAIFSMNTVNFMGGDGVSEIAGGFKLNGSGGSFAFVAMNEPEVMVDHCWFRGGWWDALTIAWNNVQTGKMVSNPPVSAGNVPGASLFVPLRIGPGESRTVQILTVWYIPETTLSVGTPSVAPGQQIGAFAGTPSHGMAKSGQQPVSGFMGGGLVNTFDPAGDVATGAIVSKPFTANRRWLHFLVGGGDLKGVGVSLLANGEPVRTARGRDSERLRWESWDLADLADKEVQLCIFDHETGPWGHINADHFLFSDEPLDPAQPYGRILADFEDDSYGDFWTLEPIAMADATNGDGEGPSKYSPDMVPTTYVPWYARRFPKLESVADEFTRNYDELVQRSHAFSECLYDSTLPPEVVEAIAANLSILKSPTVLRQHDGRLWGWEGNNDHGGSCAGTCTHVWNYAQAIAHLFPYLERTIRRTEFNESLKEDGEQAFRANLPVTPGGVAWGASDGQLGGIMKVHREWRISGDEEWLRETWPAVQRSLEYAIRTWDPHETGLLEESHHNTYDINYLGPEGHCGSFYLGALAAAAKMSEAVGDPASTTRYRELLARGRHRMETELFNGEYFIQMVPKPGREGNPGGQSEYYRAVAEEVNAQGPKYQYGDGCLSDGVLGLWMAKVCGIDEALVDPAMVRSHLESVYKYNLKRDLSAHANPQRPTYAMGNEGGLLLCTWPRGNKPLLPFVYSDEVWTGIEYQVASHLILVGCVDEGLDVVRVCRERYDGVRRNPLNEYECGHWYARAMSSFALLQSMNGIRYDAITGTLYVRYGVDNFREPIFTATGFGVVEHRGGKITVTATDGMIDVRKINVMVPDGTTIML